MIYLPDEMRGNITMINGIPFAWGRKDAYTYSSLSDQEKESRYQEATNFFRKGVFPGSVGYMWLVRKEQNWEVELDRIVARAPRHHRDALKKSNDAWLRMIRREQAQSRYEFIFALELGQQEQFLSNLTRWLPLKKDFLERLIGKTSSPVLQNDGVFMGYQRAFANQVHQMGGVEPLEAVEIADFYRQHSYQSLPMPRIGEALTTLFPWERKDKTFLLPNAIEDEGKWVRIDAPEGVQYVSYVTVALIPNKIWAPGFDLMHDIPALGCNIQGLVQWTQKGYRQARTTAGWKKKAAKANRKHISQVDDPSLMDDDGELDAELMETEIARKKSPMNQLRMVFQVTAESPDDLNEQCKTLMDHLDSKGVTAHRPSADQGEYYDSWLPGPYWSPVGYKIPQLPDRTAAIVMPGALDVVGDPTGPPKGFLTSNGSVFRFHLAWGAQNDQSSHVVLTGRTGSGKTTLIYQIVEDTMMTVPARGIIPDLKGDHERWSNHPTLKDHVQLVDLDGRKESGLLCPFHLGLDVQEAKEVALDYIEHSLGLDREQRVFGLQNDIMSAIERAISKGNPSMARVIDELGSEGMREEAREMAQMLSRAQQLPLGRLIFGETQEENRIRLPKTGLIVLRLRNLKLPGKGETAVRLSQRLSEVIMTGISVLNRQFLLEGKEQGIFSFSVLDEFEIYTRTRTGTDQVNEIIRLGRSKFCGAVVASQNPSDVPKNIRNNAGYFICLGTKDSEETELAMRAMEVDLGHETIYKTLLDLGTKQSTKANQGRAIERKDSYAYVKDLANRVGLVRFLIPQAEMREFWKTRPELEETEGEEDAAREMEKIQEVTT
ncbi:hypothetical protein GCM10007416_33950 [Kroppenstedtia guangzhouensis]|uniref:AAA-like domain-containing protein n=1 Tax=Kroppenstedtia guangzhouensis TaxID=1274356 RepID=A0ABQ1H560_9BACL|nr:ATP-binding protein [Kroppenstedtia guangzhouensis]GGA57956.1 hypothetical protein GCM10007416_33950 [Kroppenstedtia guangzhouensis]